jgi:hypothetical protein
MSMQSEVTRSYNSFSGSDIRAYIGPFPFAELQAVSYSVSREKAPIYTMGSPDPRSFSRNKRGIAGSLIWVNFDRHGLLEVFRKARGTFIANVDDVRPQYRMNNGVEYQPTALFQSGLVRQDVSIPLTAAVDDATTATDENSGWKAEAAPWLSDQILPFDVTLAGCNENGAATGMKLFGVEILNEGSGISIDDAVQEMQATFVARMIDPWQAVVSKFANLGNGQYSPQ